jgi:hypothetical protein
MDSEFIRQVRQELEEERKRSPHRNRCNYFERVHPLQHDVNVLTEFCITRRLSRPGCRDALKRTSYGNPADTAAFRILVDIALSGGTYKKLRSCCARILEGCDAIERMRARLLEVKERWRRGELSEEEALAVVELAHGPLSEADRKQFAEDFALGQEPEPSIH